MSISDRASGAGEDPLAAAGLPSNASADEIRAIRDGLNRVLAESDTQVAAELDEQPATPTAPKASRLRKGSPLRTALVVVVAIALGLGVVWGVYAMGAPAQQMPEGHPAVNGTAAPTPQPTFDAARAAQLQGLINANPDDIEARRSLATLHLRAGQFAEAAQVLTALLERRPDDFDARMILGVCQFNQGDLVGAGEHWHRAEQQRPDDQGVHYNLGFLAMSQNPPDMAGVERHWRRVIEIDPNSEMAKTVGNHLPKVLGAPETPAPTPTAPATAGGRP